MGVRALSARKKAIFLDRDGVLNEAVVKNGKPYPPATIDEVIIPSDVRHALDHLRALGFLLIGATNQPDVARGITSKKTVLDINQMLIQQLDLLEIRTCFHDNADACSCRKPQPGLLTSAAEELQIDLTKSFMIGDRYKDIEAGFNAGCKTIWLQRDYLEKKPSPPADFTTSTLMEGALWISKTIVQEL
jgi:D-glycero-D-manno-heptose 1,7-bisphosphate phosphatase